MFKLLLQLAANIYYFALHVTSAGSFPPPLSAAKEAELLEKSQNGDVDARNKLIEHNLRLVAHIVKKYYTTGAEQDDLISIGTIGLIKSVQSFNFGRNTRFSTYSARCIENEVLMAMRKLKSTENTVYLEESIDAENQNSKLTLKDSLQDDFEISEYCEARQQKDDVLKLVLQKLDARQRQIIIMRYGLFGNPQQTQQQVCEILGISRSYVSRLEKRAVEILRQELLAGDE